MPKLIDYPRTSYTGAWELAEITDDTSGKCTIETAARKLNRKVSGSFKAIIGSAVKFGLVTSKRELLTTTTLFKRIKHAYDKQEELAFHREAFLTPPLFTQICRKFRSRELPVQMLDVMLIREFGVEEINAQGVAKAFVDGCRMVGLLDERNIVADIDAFSAKQTARLQLASPIPNTNAFRTDNALTPDLLSRGSIQITDTEEISSLTNTAIDYQPVNYGKIVKEQPSQTVTATAQGSDGSTDAIATLFGFVTNSARTPEVQEKNTQQIAIRSDIATTHGTDNLNHQPNVQSVTTPPTLNSKATYQITIRGPGINTELSIAEEEDIVLAIALLEKIRRQLRE